MAEPPPNPLSAAMAHELNGNAVAPLFSAAPGAAPAAAIDLDDVFADCFFGREGDADLLDDIAAAYVVVANYIEGGPTARGGRGRGRRRRPRRRRSGAGRRRRRRT